MPPFSSMVIFVAVQCSAAKVPTRFRRTGHIPVPVKLRPSVPAMSAFVFCVCADRGLGPFDVLDQTEHFPMPTCDRKVRHIVFRRRRQFVILRCPSRRKWSPTSITTSARLMLSPKEPAVPPRQQCKLPLRLGLCPRFPTM